MFKPDGPEALRPVGETEFVNGIAAMSASGLYGKTRVAAGIVGTAQLRLGAAAGAGARRADRGRRRPLPRHPPGRGLGRRPGRAQPPHPPAAGACSCSDDFRAGFALLAPRRLTFEAWCYHRQIPDVTALARAFPDTTIILDHFGGPPGVGSYAGRAKEVYAEWRGFITELATCPNVVAKLGGINMEVNGFAWHERPRPPSSQELADATRPYYEYTIEKFGVDRCMFESNFPVDAVSCSYTVLVELVQAPHREVLGGGEGQALPRHRRAGLSAHRLTPRVRIGG